MEENGVKTEESEVVTENQESTAVEGSDTEKMSVPNVICLAAGGLLVIDGVYHVGKFVYKGGKKLVNKVFGKKKVAGKKIEVVPDEDGIDVDIVENEADQ